MARVAIVTGGTRGIGEAISIALKDMGMQVAANYAGNEERARAFKAGMDDFITKPIDAARLLAVAARFTAEAKAASFARNE